MNKDPLLKLNGREYRHSFQETSLSASFDPLQWVAMQKEYPKFYWRGRDGREIAAVGCLLCLEELPHFEKGNTSNARLVGGHAFFSSLSPKDSTWSRFPRCAFFLPKIEISKTWEGTLLIEHALSERPPHPLFQGEKGVPLSRIHHPSIEEWIECIEKTLCHIERGEIEKVVIARRSSYTIDPNPQPILLLDKLQRAGATHFAIQFDEGAIFMGATPERLYQREGCQILTEAVAGTRKRGRTKEEDLQLEWELSSSEKENREFQYVKKSIERALSPLCVSLSPIGAEDLVIKTPHVQHLHRSFQGVLKDPSSDASILTALHPTAAMGGSPKREALTYLLEHELIDRGWYGAPIGFVSEKESEFAVAIRSALFESNQVHLFAGTGIVSGSHPLLEWEELNHKMTLWRQLCQLAI